MTDLLPPHVVLVGLPGSGKTTVGRAVAAKLGRPFLDFDEELERRTGRSVADVFEREGEAYFRSLELELTRELAPRRGMVLAPGGGWPCVPGAMELLRPPAWLAYLRLTPSSALSRMAEERAVRPLLKGPDPLATLTALLERRRDRYELADAVIDVELIDMKSVIDIVRELAPVSGSK